MIRCDKTLAKRINDGNLKIKMGNMVIESTRNLQLNEIYLPDHQKEECEYFEVKGITLPFAASALT